MEAAMPRGNTSGTNTPKAAGNDMPGKRADLPVDTLSKAFFGRTGDEHRQPTPQELAELAKEQGALNEKKS
jgi:hypothetical protein